MKVLIVGLGQIGMGYDIQLDPEKFVYSHARAFDHHPFFHLIGGVDPEQQRREVFEQTYRCPAYPEIETALRDQTPDLVVIAAPTQLHCQTLLQILKICRPRAILCEKPLSYDLDEARAMTKACQEAGVSLFVNYMRRSDPGAVEVHRRIEAGEIGTPSKGVVWYSKGFLHNGSHFFNLLEYWLGKMLNWKLIDRGRNCDGIDQEPDVRLSFEKGNVVFLAAREEDFSHYTVELLAPNGRLRYEQGGRQIQWQQAIRHAELKNYTVLDDRIENIKSGLDRYQWHVAEQLSRHFNGQKGDICTAADALLTLENMHRILEHGQ